MRGLTQKEVTFSREKYGTNTIPAKKLKTGFDFFMETFKDKLNLILLAMMIVFAVLAVFGQGTWSEPCGIVVVLIAIATISTKTGLKSQKKYRRIEKENIGSFLQCNSRR